ncbi:MAG: hypothetical protein M4D85_04225 [Actinomycetota bacterium]|nr:hypothetical protein [Actinomycetota bacterium]
MDFDWLQPESSPAGVALGLGLLPYLVLVEPVLGLRSYAYLRRHRGERSRARLRVYALTLAVEGSWLVVVVLILLVSPDLGPGALGLSLPPVPCSAGPWRSRRSPCSRRSSPGSWSGHAGRSRSPVSPTCCPSHRPSAGWRGLSRSAPVSARRCSCAAC